MTCPSCGWVMCYICRQDIREAKYAHFCNHIHLLPNVYVCG
jgi:hypothetical protein